MPKSTKAIVLLQFELILRLEDLAQIEHDWEKMGPSQFLDVWGPEITRDTLAVLTKRAEKSTHKATPLVEAQTPPGATIQGDGDNPS